MGEHVDEVGKITCPVSFQNAFAGRANADIRVYPGGGPQLLDAAQAGLRRSGGEGAARAACSAASRACEARHPSPVAAEANGVVSDTASRRVRGSTVRPRAALRGRQRRAGAAAAGRATTACRRPPATCPDEGDEHEASSHVRSRSARSQVRGNRHHVVDGQIGHRAFHELRCRAGACAVLDVIELAHDVAR